MLWFWLFSLSWAQAPGGLTLGPALPAAETRFVVSDAATQRFLSGSTAVGPALTAGEAVTVVTEANGLVRVFVRGQFGWIPAAGLTTTPPPLPAPTELPSLLPPG
jgi:hypothetical protein